MGIKLFYFTKWLQRGNALLYLLLLCSFSALQAQTTVTGTVIDNTGMGIPGANVTIKGAGTGVSTNEDGQYSINAPSDAVLVFSFIGYGNQEIEINGREVVNVTLEENAQTLDEIVLIGYGSQKRQEVNGSVSKIKATDVADLTQVSIDQMMQGKASGVVVTNNSGQPGSSTSIRIRGNTSLSGTNEPLYIIDGVPVSGDATGNAMSGRPIAGGDFTSQGNNTVSPLAMLNPNDIESMDILKDASATAIYGARGANGVVIITTKSGKKGTGKLTYDSYVSFQEQAKLLDVMDLQQYARQQNELAALYGQELRPEFAHPELLGSGTNWQEEIYQTGILKNHQLAFSGGKDDTNYYISGGYTDQLGTVIGSQFKRYTFKSNVDTKVKKWLKVGAYVTGSITNEDITLNGQQNGIVSTSLLQAPDLAVRNLDGSYAGAPANNQGVAYINPVALALTKSNELVRKNFLGNVYAEISLFKGLSYRFELGANTEFSENDEFLPTYQWGSFGNEFADLNKRRQNWYSWNVKNLLTYRNTFAGKHDVTVLAGQEANESTWDGMYAYATGFLSNDVHTISVADASQSTVNDYKGSQALNSYFGRAIYTFDDRYSIQGSIRADGSSKFDPVTKKQWGYFPAVSGSWTLSNEGFMEGTKKYIDNIRFRAGYGEVGNQQIGNNRYGANLSFIGTGLGTGTLFTNMANPNVTWETSKQTNLGIDFTLFSNRLSATVEFYNKRSEDFLTTLPLPYYLTGGPNWEGGIDPPYVNLGEIQNKGIDLTLSYKTDPSKDFSWNSTLIFSRNRNKVVSLNDGLVLMQEVNTNDYTTVTATNTVVGQPMGQFYGYQTLGIIRDQDQLDNAPLIGIYNGDPVQSQLGDVLYADLNDDGVINDDDRTFIGNPYPDFTYGFTNNFRYKGIDLSIFLQGSQGNDILNLTGRTGTLNTNLYQNQLAEAADYWTVDNPNASLPRPVSNLGHSNLLISDRYVEDGSYLRIQNITLGYTLPSDITSKVSITKLRIYGGVQNLHTFTKYKGYDPEVGSFNQNALLTGVDNGRYPSPRSFTMGLNVEF
ncbi:SusC/RagA family TonB-linked outer membrane protein [Flavobacterium beibuense]|uniref:SusC-like TonB-dependent receptor n=1 Tax=Flavobacterium beibuense TaxID=657326 RepID=A0A444W875_9FLAO|nr:TonB-dependent receptor [Flavobacterium beibuense]RYJ42079.1 SusC-like TonB-dependent receptor [Flavobacterium beibuense]